MKELVKIYVLYSSYDYEGCSNPVVTSDPSEAVEFLNGNIGDEMTVEQWEGDEQTFRGNWRLVKSWNRMPGQKLIKNL